MMQNLLKFNQGVEISERIACKMEPEENELGSTGNYFIDVTQMGGNKSTFINDNFIEIKKEKEFGCDGSYSIGVSQVDSTQSTVINDNFVNIKIEVENDKMHQNEELNQLQDSSETDDKTNSANEENTKHNCPETTVGILPCDLLKVEIDNEHAQDTWFDLDEEYKPKLVLSRRKLMSDEKLKIARERDRLRKLEQRRNMSEEQLAALREKQKLIAREKRKNLQGEKLLEVREKQRIRAVMKRMAMSEEKLKEVREKDKLRAQEKRRNMDAEKMLEFREKQRIQAQEKRKNYSEEKLKEVRERERIRARERRQSLSKEKLEEVREREKIRAQEKRKAKHLQNLLLQSLENPFGHILDTHPHLLDSNHSNTEFEPSITNANEINNSSLLKDNSDVNSTKGLSKGAFESNDIADILGINNKVVETINPSKDNELVSTLDNTRITSESNIQMVTSHFKSEYECVIEKTNTTVKNLIDIAQNNQYCETVAQNNI